MFKAFLSKTVHWMKTRCPLLSPKQYSYLRSLFLVGCSQLLSLSLKKSFQRRKMVHWKKLMENNATQSKEELPRRLKLKLNAMIVNWLLSEKRKEGGPFDIFLENNFQGLINSASFLHVWLDHHMCFHEMFIKYYKKVPLFCWFDHFLYLSNFSLAFWKISFKKSFWN